MDISGPAAPSSARFLPGAALTVVGWAATFIAFGFVGRATIIDGQALSLVWPAAGIAALWVADGWGVVRRSTCSSCRGAPSRSTG